MAKIITANPAQGDMSVLSDKERRGAALHSLRDSMIRHKVLTGNVSSIDHVEAEGMEGTQDFVTVIYNGVQVIIPITEMGFTEAAKSTPQRANMTANSMAGAEIDFIVQHVDTDRGVAMASRERAMKQKAKDFYLGDGDREAIVKPGQLVEARIIGVMPYSLRLEVLGVEKYVRSRDLSREWVANCTKKYEVGGTIVVRVTDIKTEDGNVQISVEGARIHEPYKTKCRIGGRYVGEVTGYSEGRFFIHLDEGTNALAHTSAAMDYIPKTGDVVAFVVSRILTENEIDTVTGKIARVIRKYRLN